MDPGAGHLPVRTVRTPHFGSCASPGGPPRCALLASSCDAAKGEQYSPPARVGGGGPPCLSPAFVGVGRCKSCESILTAERAVDPEP